MKYFFTVAEASSDEAGKGEFFGGFSVCCILLTEEKYEKLKNLPIFPKIKDSKKLNDETIKEIAPILLDFFGVHCAHMQITAQQYNEMYKKYKNLNLLLAYAHNQVWEKIKSKHDISGVKKIIDKFCEKELYQTYMQKLNQNCVDLDIFTYRAESLYFSCAIASIIARYFYVEELDSITKKFGVVVPAGNAYGGANCVVEAYKNLLQATGAIERNNQYCKNNFQTLPKILASI